VNDPTPLTLTPEAAIMTVAVSSRHETPPAGCAAPDCTNPLPPRGKGRPARYCSPACRARTHRHRQPGKIIAEVDQGSSTSRGRPAERRWLVRLRRDQHYVIVAWGLTEHAAHHLAEAITTTILEPGTQTASDTTTTNK
jgi:hypothetical protein